MKLTVFCILGFMCAPVFSEIECPECYTLVNVRVEFKNADKNAQGAMTFYNSYGAFSRLKEGKNIRNMIFKTLPAPKFIQSAREIPGIGVVVIRGSAEVLRKDRIRGAVYLGARGKFDGGMRAPIVTEEVYNRLKVSTIAWVSGRRGGMLIPDYIGVDDDLKEKEFRIFIDDGDIWGDEFQQTCNYILSPGSYNRKFKKELEREGLLELIKNGIREIENKIERIGGPIENADIAKHLDAVGEKLSIRLDVMKALLVLFDRAKTAELKRISRKYGFQAKGAMDTVKESSAEDFDDSMKLAVIFIRASGSLPFLNKELFSQTLSGLKVIKINDSLK
ncbi:hypothetical protein ACFL6Y_06050 [Elusimicrobiota bacterium]